MMSFLTDIKVVFRRMKKVYYLFVLLVIFISSELKAQQEIQFTQYIFNTLSVNPAYAGYKEEWFAQMALRKQWAGLQGAPQPGHFSIDGIVSPYSRNLGVGLQVTADELGPQKATSMYMNYAYRLRLNDEDTERLSFGIGAGISHYGLDETKFSPVDGTDSNLYGDEKVWKWNLRAGVYYYNPKWYAGLSVMNLLENDENSIFGTDDSYYEVKHRRHLYFITGAVFDLSPTLKLRPSLLVKEDFKGPTSLDINGMLIFNQRFWFGASYRTGVNVWDKNYKDFSVDKLDTTNALSGIMQLYVTERFRVGYSYDHMLNSLSDVEKGTHEITLGYTFPLRSKRLLSPRFF